MPKVRALVVICLVAALAGCSQASGTHGKVLVIVRDGSENLEGTILKELDPMLGMLKCAGISVALATSSGERVAIDKASFTPDLKLEAVRIGDYDGLLIPCMASVLRTEEVVLIVRDASAAGIPIAAGDGAVFNLAAAGVLKGKRYALDPGFADSVKEGVNAGAGVVQDGVLITAGTCATDPPDPTRKDGTRELTSKLIRAVRERVEKQAKGGEGA